MNLRRPTSARFLPAIALAIAVWRITAASTAEAATCGHYVYRPGDLASLEAGGAGHLVPTMETHDFSQPRPACQGPQCGRQPGAPASPSPLVRSIRLHEPLLIASRDLELNQLVSYFRLVRSLQPATGYPTRIKRPPRLDRGLLA